MQAVAVIRSPLMTDSLTGTANGSALQDITSAKGLKNMKYLCSIKLVRNIARSVLMLFPGCRKYGTTKVSLVEYQDVGTF